MDTKNKTLKGKQIDRFVSKALSQKSPKTKLQKEIDKAFKRRNSVPLSKRIGNFVNSMIPKKKSKLNYAFIPKLFGAGILGIVMYDLWTNFGFWLSFSKLYPSYLPPTFDGLVMAYTWGIPVMIWHILSGAIAITVIAIPLLYFKEHEILKRELVLKPVEKYAIACSTAVLMVLSILSAIV